MSNANQFSNTNPITSQSNSAPTVYPFPQEPTKVSQAVASGIDLLQSVGVNEDHILDIYMYSLQFSSISAKRETRNLEPIRSPFHYLSTLKKTPKAVREVTADEYVNAFNNTVLRWKDIPPLEFMVQYVAHIYHEKNDSGLENGMISTRLFARTISPDKRLLIVDPSPSFITHIVKKEELRNIGLVFAFSTPRYSAVYKAQQWQRNICCISVDEVDWTVQYTAICIMGASTAYDDITKLLDDYAAANQNSSCMIFLLLPTAYADRRSQGDSLRATINTKYNVLQIVLIDAGAINIKPKKRCMMVLRRQHSTPTNIPIQQVFRSGDQLCCRDTIYVPYQEFLNCEKTLSALYSSNKNSPAGKRTRKKPEVLWFSLIICLFYTIETIRSSTEKFRGKYRFYDFPSEIQAQRNHFSRGTVLSPPIIGKTVDSPEYIYDDGERLLMTHETLSAIVREAVIPHILGKPVDVKTFWYTFLSDLEATHKYDDSLCRSLFLGKDWSERSICQLIIGQSTTEDVRHAVTEYCNQNSISDTRKEMIYAQLAIVWNLAIEKRFPTSNPIYELLESISARNEVKEEMRDALALRSLTITQMRRTVDLLDQDQEHPVMALIAKLKMYMRLSSGVVAALTIGDFIAVPNHPLKLLSITKSLPQTGNKAESFIRPSQNTILPVPTPLAKKLTEYIKSRIDDLLALGIAESEIHQYALFPSARDLREPIRTRRINEYLASLFKTLDMPEIWIYNPDDDIGSDIGEYHKDLFISNWEHHAVHTLRMDVDAISYIAGRTPETVVGSNYRDFTHLLQLEALSVELEKLIAKVELPSRITDISRNKVTLSKNSRHFTCQPCSEPTEMVFDIKLSEDEALYMDVNVPYGCRISIEYM